MVRSEVTVEDSEGNVNGAGIQEEGRTWCRDVARREGQDSAFESIWLQDMEERESRGKGDGFEGPRQIVDTGERTHEASLCVRIKGLLTKRL